MSKSKRRLWSFNSRSSVYSVPVVLIALLILVTVFQKVVGWPSRDSETVVLVGVFIFSLMPVVLALLDTIMERGAVIKYRDFELNFSQVVASVPPSISMSENMGVAGQPIHDNDSNQILPTLRQAINSDVVVVDLEDGSAWWETRLLILVAGAVRFSRPEVIVFVATDRGVAKRFQGWAYPRDLLRRLLTVDPQYAPQYARSYYNAATVARQWGLIKSTRPATPGALSTMPQWLAAMGATREDFAFDLSSGLPNELAVEQFLAVDLGNEIEMPEQQKGGPKGISVARLEELFRPVLRTDFIDEAWPNARQLESFLDSNSPYVAVTKGDSYSRLLPRLSGVNAIVKSLIIKEA